MPFQLPSVVPICRCSGLPSWQPDVAFNVYREGLEKYTPPFLIDTVEEKIILVHIGASTGPKPLNESQRLPARIEQFIFLEQITMRKGMNVLYSENILQMDPLEKHLDDAQRWEIFGQIEKADSELVLKRRTGRYANVIPSQFELTVKHPRNEEPVDKARFVLGGRHDKEKTF